MGHWQGNIDFIGASAVEEPKMYINRRSKYLKSQHKALWASEVE